MREGLGRFGGCRFNKLVVRKADSPFRRKREFTTWVNIDLNRFCSLVERDCAATIRIRKNVPLKAKGCSAQDPFIRQRKRSFAYADSTAEIPTSPKVPKSFKLLG